MADVQNIANIGVRFSIDYGNTATNTAPLKTAGTAIATVEKQMSSARYAGMNFNRVIQDSPFFFQNFNMGIMSVANNIAPLAESLAMAKQQGAGLGMVLKGMFTGMGGWLTVLNLVVAGVQAVTFEMAKSKRETKEVKEEQDKYLATLKEIATFKDGGGVSFTRQQVETAIYRATKERADLEGAISLLRKGDTAYLLKQNEIYKQTNGQRGFAISAESESLFLGKSTVEQYKKRVAEIDKERIFLNENLDKIKEREAVSKRLLSLGGSGAEKGEAKAIQEVNVKMAERNNLLSAELSHIETMAQIQKVGDFEQLLLKRQHYEQLIDERKKFNEDFSDLQYKQVENTARINQMLNENEESLLEFEFGDVDIKAKDKVIPGLNKPSATASAFTTAFTSTFTTGMNQAWEQIFGKANSIGEMFIQSFVSSLVSNMASGLADVISGTSGGGGGGGFFGSILGTIGSFFGLLSANTGGGLIGASGGAGMQTVNINVDGKTFMKAVVEPNLNKSMSNIARYNRL